MFIDCILDAIFIVPKTDGFICLCCVLIIIVTEFKVSFFSFITVFYGDKPMVKTDAQKSDYFFHKQ